MCTAQHHATPVIQPAEAIDHIESPWQQISREISSHPWSMQCSILSGKQVSIHPGHDFFHKSSKYIRKIRKH
jgi:hypothetical protein